MGLFGKLIEITPKTVTLPVDVVKDVVTLGGFINDHEGSYTLDKCEEIYDDIESLGDE